MKRQLLFTFALALVAAVFPAMTMAMTVKPIVCENDVVLNTLSTESETVKCCDPEERFKAAASAVKEAHSLVQEKCREAGYELSAIARVCVTYKEVSDGKCVAVATVAYTCGCCIVRSPEVKDCKNDEKHCTNDLVADEFTVGARYRCCEEDKRWNATYDTMKKAFSEVHEKCSRLRCVGGTGVRGFQIDYGVVDADEGVCAVKSTIIYSCCCVCAQG